MRLPCRCRDAQAAFWSVSCRCCFIGARIWCVVMRYPSDRPLSLQEWLVLCIACEQPTYGFAVAGLLSRDGRLGRIWHVPKPAIYRAVLRLERLGLLRVAGQQHTNQEPDRLLVTATRPGRRAARGCHAPTSCAWP